jgi:hypothetical protein
VPQYAFDLNNWYYGVISGEKQLKATMRFYAWADHDQMPIVSRTVDWGDQSPLDRTSSSKYKNQKPYCGTTVKECSGYEGLTCKTSFDCPAGTGTCVETSPHFGNDPEACNQGYFQFEHTYLCNDNLNLDECGWSENPPLSSDVPVEGCMTDTACFYRPRVQVLDNWGWCTGNCFGTAGGCYDRSASGGLNSCSIDQPLPWVNFDGYIKVNK